VARDIKIIDLFSGPGGLGEGFSAYEDASGERPFKIVTSIEKDSSAHRTLKLRAFYRSFDNNVPDAYYNFLKGNLGSSPEDSLFQDQRFSEHIKQAEREARKLTLGEDNLEIETAIQDALGSDECVLIGGPPCQAYSIAGRARNVSKADYRIEDDHRSRLYKEYLNVIARFQPLIFVMENVKGILSSKLDGANVFESVRSDLQQPCNVTGISPSKGRRQHQYHVISLVCPLGDKEQQDPHNFIVKSEDLGVPQQRHRVILLGIRKDIAYKWDDEFLLSKASKCRGSDWRSSCITQWIIKGRKYRKTLDQVS